MKLSKLFLYGLYIVPTLSNAYTLSMSVSFGGTSFFNDDTRGYLVAESTGATTSSLTSVSDFMVETPATDGEYFTNGDMIGSYVVFQDNMTTADFGFGLEVASAMQAYETTDISASIVEGSDIGLIIVHEGSIYAYSGDDTPDSANGGTMGWSFGAEGTELNLVEADGFRISIPDDLTTIGSVGEAIPEPSTALLSLAGLFSLITRRRRLV